MSIFPKFHKKYGKPLFQSSVSNDLLNDFDGKIPKEIVSLWKEDGLGGYIDGLIWTIDPRKYNEYLPKWINIGSDGIPFLRSAFGDLIIYYNRKKEDNIVFINVRPQKKEYICEKADDFFDNILLLNNDFFTHIGKLNLFYEAKNIYGSLRNDQCYGYEPLLALGGKETVKNLKVLNFDVHLDILTQALKEPL